MRPRPGQVVLVPWSEGRIRVPARVLRVCVDGAAVRAFTPLGPRALAVELDAIGPAERGSRAAVAVGEAVLGHMRDDRLRVAPPARRLA